MADISEIQLSDNTSYDVEDTPARTIIGVTADSENNISKIKLADNTEYNLKDTQARASIETITTDVKNQVNADKDLINDGVDFIDDETLTNYDDKIAEMQEAYKSFIPINTTSGETVQIDNSTSDKAITSIGLDGNTEQTTYTGKNLLPISAFSSTTQGGVTLTNNNDGSYTINGTASGYVGFTLFSNMNFTGNNTYVLKETATTGLTAYLQTGTETVSCTTHSTTDKNIKNIVIGIQSGTVLNNLTIKPYVYSGNYDSSVVYEPYVGGTASPNPDYPQEVKVVTGDNTINVVGRNVLKINDATNIGYYLNYNIQDGVIRITGTAQNTYSTCALSSLINISELNKIPNGTKLTFSVLDIEGLSASQIFIGKAGNNYWMQPNATTKKVTVTKDADISGMTIWFSTTQGQEYNIKMSPMLEIGENASPFEEYQKQSYPINLGIKNLWQPSEALSGYLPQSGAYPTTNPSYPNSRYILVQLIKGQSFTINNNGAITPNFRLRYIDPETNLIIGTVFQGENNGYVSSGIDYSAGNQNGTVRALRNVILGLWDFNAEITNMTACVGTKIQTISDNPIELAKNGNYINKIYNDDNDKKWYLRQEARKELQKGTESWTLNSSTSDYYEFVRWGLSPVAVTGYVNAITDYFSNQTNNRCITNGQAVYIRVPASAGITTASAFTTWLTTHNVTMWYVLATPIVTEITDTNLINQLEAIKLLSGTQNNFSIDADTLPTLNINYIAEASSHL